MWTYFSLPWGSWYVHFASCFYINIYCIMGCYYTLYLNTYGYFSYFTRFTMKRGDADSWNSGWKRSKHWKPILHCSKNPETPWNLFLELIRIAERKKYTRGPTPCPGDRRAPPPHRARPPISWAPWWASGIHLLLYEGFYPGKKSWASLWDETLPPRGGTLAEPI